MLRKTSSYLVLIVTETPTETLDEVIARNKDYVPIETTSKYTGMCGLRFRARTNDTIAYDVAAQIADGMSFKVFTGYGVNQREVKP